ncbi:hypothetical protein CGMCC3_g16426 [Colletotrichum fructicola]|nr:uncharacterized protein CGMCC3_g16426 [Colletotrichum fructicola]KAE9567427.1 hypothetical protein CGMCC3_g16426 [Colletotrichum fructicola]KAF4881526.1 hypothetical protein CGCFRS4_v015471 [Colletotrichum fructicola]
MTRKTRQRGHQWSDEFGVKGRRTGLVLKDLNIDPKGMPDVDALFESTMELEDEGESTQKSPMPVVKHKRGKKVNGHRGISNTRLPFQEDDKAIYRGSTCAQYYQRTSRSSELGNVCWMFCDVAGIPQCIGTSQNLRLIRFEDAVTNYGKEVDYAIERANKGKGKEE